MKSSGNTGFDSFDLVSSTANLVSRNEINQEIAIYIPVKCLDTVFPPFEISASKLINIVDSRNVHELKELGGVDYLAKALCTDLKYGVDFLSYDHEPTYLSRREYYGSNKIDHLPQKSFLALLWDALHDKTLMMLIIASIFSFSIGIYKDHFSNDPNNEGYNWVEGLAIMTAVIIVVLVSSVNDYQKETQFQKLNAKKEDRLIKVIRNGQETQISIYDIVVGDIVIIEPGDIIAADGIVIESHNLSCDESGVTGESDTVKKGRDISDPFLISGTKVLEGVGKFLTVAVGENSSNGKLLISLQTVKENTPLQIKLNNLAEKIAKMGAAIALLMLLSLSIKYILTESLSDNGFPSTVDIFNNFTNIFIQAITILVVAVPEGLPMAVTISLAYATNKMLEDNNLVRVLAACETMGNVTTICSDKTGTLTTNVMSVVRGNIACTDFKTIKEVKNMINLLNKKVQEILIQGICINSTAFESTDLHGKLIFIGSKTEIALLNMVKCFGVDYNNIRESSEIIQLYPFSSSRKSMSVIIKIKNDEGVIYREIIKGASEIILERCEYYLDKDGSIQPLPIGHKLTEFQAYIQNLAVQGLRTISLAFKDNQESEINIIELKNTESPSLSKLVLIGIVGIEDPIREGVPEAVIKCQKAGISLKMVTGDNISTASSIAKRCNILMRGGLVMEGARFRKLNNDALNEIVPRLQVLARSSPLDKQILVRKLKEMNETVAVTGDGANDGPALKAADVGFSMGITGTEVAKESSSIILMDDNFTSIVKAVEWGRCINDSIRKFLEFQLSVNVTAVTIAFFSALTDPENSSVLTAVQLLWVNLLMDTLAALALATEKPTPNLLERLPESRKSNLITFEMYKMIIGQSIFQICISLLILNFGYKIFKLDPDIESDAKILKTVVFNIFVSLQIFNEFNCRCLGDKALNIFKGLGNSKVFLSIIAFSITGQILIVQFGGRAFGTVPLPLYLWIISIGIGLLSWLLAIIIKFVPDWRTPKPPERIIYSREKLEWQAAYDDVRHGLLVFSALRRAP